MKELNLNRGNNELFFSREYKMALLLSCAGGFLECYSLSYRGFWGMMMTGNMFYLTKSLVSGEFSRILIYLPVIVSFFIGIYMANFLQGRLAGREKTVRRDLQAELLIIAALLLAVILIPTAFTETGGMREADETAWQNIAANCLLGFSGGFFAHSFASFDQKAYAPTMMTGNLIKLSTALYQETLGDVGESGAGRGEDENKQKGRWQTSCQYLLIILCFLSFAGLCHALFLYVYQRLETSALLIAYFPNLTLLIPLSLILAVCRMVGAQEG